MLTNQNHLENSETGNFNQVVPKTQNFKSVKKALRFMPTTLGFFPRIALRIRGRKDGKQGLPSTAESGTITSPHIAWEQNVMETFAAQKFAEHEMAISRCIEEVERIDLVIDNIKDKVSAKVSSEPPNPTEDELGAVLKQEQGAPPAVIRARRQNEWSKKNAAYYSELRLLKGKLDALQEQRAKLLAFCNESAAVTRLMIEKKRDITRQRVDIYYQGALSKHSDKDGMPPSLECYFENYAERIYNKQHRLENIYNREEM